MQGFDFKPITFKAYVTMFERKEIGEYIYEVIAEPSNKYTQ